MESAHTCMSAQEACGEAAEEPDLPRSRRPPGQLSQLRRASLVHSNDMDRLATNQQLQLSAYEPFEGKGELQHACQTQHIPLPKDHHLASLHHDDVAGVLHICLPKRKQHQQQHKPAPEVPCCSPCPGVGDQLLLVPAASLAATIANAAILQQQACSSADNQSQVGPGCTPAPEVTSAEPSLLADKTQITRALGASAFAAAAATAALTPQLAFHRAGSSRPTYTPDLPATPLPGGEDPAQQPQAINLCSFCGQERPCSAPCPLAVAVATLQGLQLKGIYATGRFRVACFATSAKGSQASCSPMASSAASLSTLTSPPDSPPDSPSRALHRSRAGAASASAHTLCSADPQPTHPTTTGAASSSSYSHYQPCSMPASRDSSWGSSCTTDHHHHHDAGSAYPSRDTSLAAPTAGAAAGDARVPGSSSASGRRGKRHSQVQVQRRGRFMVVTYDDVVSAAKAAALAAIVSAGDEDGGVAAAQFAATASLCEASHQLSSITTLDTPAAHHHNTASLLQPSCAANLLARAASAHHHNTDAAHAPCSLDTSAVVAAATAAVVLDHAASFCAQAAMQDCNDVAQAVAIAAGPDGDMCTSPCLVMCVHVGSVPASNPPTPPPSTCSLTAAPTTTITTTAAAGTGTGATAGGGCAADAASSTGSSTTGTPFKHGVSKVYRRGRFNIHEVLPACTDHVTTTTTTTNSSGAASVLPPSSATTSPIKATPSTTLSASGAGGDGAQATRVISNPVAPTTTTRGAAAGAGGAAGGGIDRVRSEGSISLTGAGSLRVAPAPSLHAPSNSNVSCNSQVDRCSNGPSVDTSCNLFSSCPDLDVLRASQPPATIIDTQQGTPSCAGQPGMAEPVAYAFATPDPAAAFPLCPATVPDVSGAGSGVSGGASPGLPCVPGTAHFLRQDLRPPSSCSPTVPSHLSFSYWVRPGGTGAGAGTAGAGAAGAGGAVSQGPPSLESAAAAVQPGAGGVGDGGVVDGGVAVSGVGGGRVCSRLGSRTCPGQQLFQAVQEHASCSFDEWNCDVASLLPASQPQTAAAANLTTTTFTNPALDPPASSTHLLSTPPATTAAGSQGHGAGPSSLLSQGIAMGGSSPSATGRGSAAAAGAAAAAAGGGGDVVSPVLSPFSRVSDNGVLYGSPGGTSCTLGLSAMDSLNLSSSISHGGGGPTVTPTSTPTASTTTSPNRLRQLHQGGCKTGGIRVVLRSVMHPARSWQELTTIPTTTTSHNPTSTTSSSHHRPTWQQLGSTRLQVCYQQQRVVVVLVGVFLVLDLALGQQLVGVLVLLGLQAQPASQ